MLEGCSVHENAPLFDLQILSNCGSLCGASFFQCFQWELALARAPVGILLWILWYALEAFKQTYEVRPKTPQDFLEFFQSTFTFTYKF